MQDYLQTARKCKPQRRVARPGDNRAMEFGALAHHCWLERISLSATGFYRTPDIQGTFAKAHNVYLENMLELGIPASLALFAAVAGLAVLCVIGVRRRRQNAVYPCVGLGATVLVAVHGIVDFSLQIPAITVTYAFLMGIAAAQCWSSRRPEDPW